MNLVANSGFFTFDRHLPVYNWMYPLQQKALGKVALQADRRLLTGRDYERIVSRALYFHVPFCETICSFCPFVRGTYRHADEVERYVQALCREIELKARLPGFADRPVTVIFFGGGTPSLLSPGQIRRIGAAVARSFDLALDEFSYEMELKSIDEERLDALREIGVTHARFGLQTFQPRFRQLFDLTATVEQARVAVPLLKRFFPFTSFDILYGMDGETVDELLDDLGQAVELGTPTIDVYPINNAVTQLRLHRAYEQARLEPISATTKLAMNVLVNEFMRAAGLLPHNGHGYVRASHEEISRRPVVSDSYSFRYHEYVYGYDDRELLGFGASAVSTLSGITTTNVVDRDRYVRDLLETRSCDFVATRHSPEADSSRPVILHLPYHGHVDSTRVDWRQVYPETRAALEQASAAGLVEEHGKRLELTQKGWYSYVNLMYFLMPEAERRMIDAFVAKRRSQPGRRLGELRLAAAR